MNCRAGKTDAEIMQMIMEGNECEDFIGLKAVEIGDKLGFGYDHKLDDVILRYTKEQWVKLSRHIREHNKTCEDCWHSKINQKFVRDRDDS